ncbi:MAG: ABC transporter ATP-binding protein [Caldilinea sp. CFX5]|nr:ABC transporter ATP-binding protein [Caldilinea sp. CFX5]
METEEIIAEEAGIRLHQVRKRYGEVGAANGVSFHLQRGQLMALLGPSGCGKTTTLRLIAGFEQVDSGEVKINGQCVACHPHVHLPPEKRRVGMVFQEYALFPHLTVAQNVAFGLHHYGGDKPKRVAAVLDLVGLAGLEKRMPNELSGGQQQRVALARALAPEPDVVLLDEPFSNLDAGLRVRVRAEVRAILREANATAIFVTHDQEEALSLVDQVAVLINGVVQQQAAPQQLYIQPANRQVAEFLGDVNFLPGQATGKVAECALGRLATLNENQGAVDVLLRPENIHAEPAATPTNCQVQQVLFFGHDQLVTVQFDNGLRLRVRADAFQQFQTGQAVQLRVKGPVMAYRRDS